MVMKSITSSLLLTAVMALSATLLDAAAQDAQVPRSQADIAADLRSDDIDTMLRGMRHLNFPVSEWTPALRSALLYALESEIRRDLEAQAAQIYRWHDEPAMTELAYRAMVIQDPAAIPSLALVVGELSYARSALVAFGRQALPDVIRVARWESPVLACCPEMAAFEADGSLLTLREMVEHWGLAYFTPEEQAQLKGVVAMYLSPDTPPLPPGGSRVIRGFLLKYAAGVAMALNDTEARGWIEHMATNAEAYSTKTGDPPYGQAHLRRVLVGNPEWPPLPPLSRLFDRYDRMAK